MACVVRGIWRHRNGFFYFSRERRGKRRTVALQTKDKTTAIIRALEICDAPELALPGSFSGEIEEFIACKLSRNEFSRFSAENKRLTLLRFAKEFGLDKSPAAIKTSHLQDFYNSERGRVAESTAQSYMMCIRSFLSWLVDERKVLASSPAKGLRMGRWDYGSKGKFCEASLRDILLDGWKSLPAEILSPEQAQMIGFVVHAGFEAGLRKNEIIEARPSWVDIESGNLRVEKTPSFVPKDREERSIPLTDTFAKFLHQFPLAGTWCIASESPRGRSRYRYDFTVPYRKYLSYMSRQTGQNLDWVTPHIMRHTFASLLVSANVSLYKVAKWLGDDPRVVDRHYAKLSEGDREVNKLRKLRQKRSE